MNHIVLEGFMGSGKGTVGKKLAAEMQLPLVDTDKMIADRMKMTPGEIYDRFGDVYYRALETFVLSELMELKDRSVIIVGSGLPIMPQNETYLHDLGKVFYLKSDEGVMLAKLERSKKRDWLSEDEDLRDRAKKMLAEREPYYTQLADEVILVGRRNASEVTEEIISKLENADVPAKEAEVPEETVQAPTQEEPAEKPVKKRAKRASAKKAAEETAEADKAETEPAAVEEPQADPAEEKKPVKKPAAKKAAAKKPAEKKTTEKKTAEKKKTPAKKKDDPKESPEKE